VGRLRIDPSLREFVKLRPQVEAVLQHVGLETWDLVLVDVTGLWVRDVYPSEEEARRAADRLGIRVHAGWDDPRITRRVQARDQWATPDGQRRAL
jgi:hypothetical protein